MGGSSPSKPEMTLSEKAQHAVAAAEWDHYKQNYAPLENRYLSDSRKDYEGRTQAQSASQVMREGTEAMRLSALGGGVSKVGGTVADALTMSNVESASSAQQLRDNRMTGALGIGRDIATGTTSSMASLARTGAQGSINNMRNKLTVDMAKDRAVAQLAAQAAEAAAGGMSGGGGGTPTASNSLYTNAALQRTNTQQQASWAPPPSVRR